MISSTSVLGPPTPQSITRRQAQAEAFPSPISVQQRLWDDPTSPFYVRPEHRETLGWTPLGASETSESDDVSQTSGCFGISPAGAVGGLRPLKLNLDATAPAAVGTHGTQGEGKPDLPRQDFHRSLETLAATIIPWPANETRLGLAKLRHEPGSSDSNIPPLRISRAAVGVAQAQESFADPSSWTCTCKDWTLFCQKCRPGRQAGPTHATKSSSNPVFLPTSPFAFGPLFEPTSWKASSEPSAPKDYEPPDLYLPDVSGTPRLEARTRQLERQRTEDISVRRNRAQNQRRNGRRAGGRRTGEW